jgi:hypothetical protein
MKYIKDITALADELNKWREICILREKLMTSW